MRPELELTDIELQLLQALLRGGSNKDIARELGKSEYTVRNQLAAAFQKIGVANRMQAAFWFRAYQSGLERRTMDTPVGLGGQAQDRRLRA
jgi:two-component system nitrate/nitrite response regulator NarP